MSSELLDLGSGRIHVEDIGRTDAPALLFIPGGPGLPCFSFAHWQGPLLSERFRVIAFDPRGVLRSDPLDEDEPLTEQTLVDDVELLRERLGIEKWAIIGHSFGGRTALRYAGEHSEHVTALLFENPGLDPIRAQRYRMPKAVRALEEIGDLDAAERCRRLIVDDTNLVNWALLQEFFDKTWHRLEVRSPERVEAMAKAFAAGGFTPDQIARGDVHKERVMSNDIGSLLHLLPALSLPVLYLYGEHDMVTPPDVVEEFESVVPRGVARRIDGAAHDVHYEAPDIYAQVVTEFLLDNDNTRM